MKKQIFNTLIGSCIIVMLVAMSVLAQRPSSVRPVGTVEKAVALAAVKKHRNTLLTWRKQIDSLYDYNTVTETMKSSFERNGVRGKAAENAQTWGQNIVYLSLGGSTFFYRYHLARLDESQQRLSSPDVKWARQSELDDIERGMRDWNVTAKQVADTMRLMVEYFAQQAKFLDKKFEVEKQRQAATPEQRPAFVKQILYLAEQAKSKRRMASEMDARVKRTGRSVYFEALNVISETIEPCPVTTNVVAPAPVNLIVIPKPNFDGGPLR